MSTTQTQDSDSRFLLGKLEGQMENLFSMIRDISSKLDDVRQRLIQVESQTLNADVPNRLAEIEAKLELLEALQSERRGVSNFLALIPKTVGFLMAVVAGGVAWAIARLSQ